MEIGRYTYGHNQLIEKWSQYANLKIGSFCSIGSNIKIYLGGNHNTGWVTTYPFGHIFENVFPYHGQGHPTTKGDIVIGSDVWIGDNVTIMSGVKIGDGAVIANNSHIVKSVEPYSINGGNPSKIIKLRFTEEQIAKLLRIKWWEWEEDRICRSVNLLCSENIDQFISQNQC
jgi:acetyltransferase-like isoleucine patch superfamily enzyme